MKKSEDYVVDGDGLLIVSLVSTVVSGWVKDRTPSVSAIGDKELWVQRFGNLLSSVEVMLCA